MFLDYPTTSAPPVEPAPSWRAVDVVIGLAAGVLGFALIIGAVVVVVTLFSLEGEAENIALAVATAAFELWLGVWVLVAAWRRGIGAAGLGLERPIRWGPAVTAWLGSYVVLFGYFAFLLFLESLGLNTERFMGGNALPYDVTQVSAVTLILGFSVVVLAPLCEELFFRGLLFKGLHAGWGMFPALLVSGFLFGAFHQNLSVLIPFTFIGMLFAWAYHESGSLWTPIAAHAAVNGLAFGLSVSGVAA